MPDRVRLVVGVDLQFSVLWRGIESFSSRLLCKFVVFIEQANIFGATSSCVRDFQSC